MYKRLTQPISKSIAENFLQNNEISAASFILKLEKEELVVIKEFVSSLKNVYFSNILETYSKLAVDKRLFMINK